MVTKEANFSFGSERETEQFAPLEGTLFMLFSMTSWIICSNQPDHVLGKLDGSHLCFPESDMNFSNIVNLRPNSRRLSLSSSVQPAPREFWSCTGSGLGCQGDYYRYLLALYACFKCLGGAPSCSASSV